MVSAWCLVLVEKETYPLLGDEAEKGVKLSAAQSAILLALGLQRKTIEDVEVCAVNSPARFISKC